MHHYLTVQKVATHQGACCGDSIICGENAGCVSEAEAEQVGGRGAKGDHSHSLVPVLEA